MEKKSRIKHKGISDERIIELLEQHTVAEAVKILGYSKGGFRYLMRRRGIKAFRWRENIAAAARGRRNYNHQDMIVKLKELGIKLGRRPRRVDLDGQYPSRDTYQVYFGSWRKALEAAGFDMTVKPKPKKKKVKEKKKRKRQVKPPKRKLPLEERVYSRVTTRLRFAVLKRDGFKCMYCGHSPRENEVVLQMDHVVPQSKGGLTTYDNLVSSCRRCNHGKYDSLLDD